MCLKCNIYSISTTKQPKPGSPLKQQRKENERKRKGKRKWKEVSEKPRDQPNSTKWFVCTVNCMWRRWRKKGEKGKREKGITSHFVKQFLILMREETHNLAVFFIVTLKWTCVDQVQPFTFSLYFPTFSSKLNCTFELSLNSFSIWSLKS